MSDDSDEPVFSIDFSDLNDINQIEKDELKYDEVPDDVWVLVRQDLEGIPPIISIQDAQKEADEPDQNTTRFVDVTADNLDEITSKNNAKNPQNQTKWAITMFRGK